MLEMDVIGIYTGHPRPRILRTSAGEGTLRGRRRFNPEPGTPVHTLCGRVNGKQPYGCGKVTRAYHYVFKTVHMAHYKFAYF
jgi:hypothetical protein